MRPERRITSSEAARSVYVSDSASGVAVKGWARNGDHVRVGDGDVRVHRSGGFDGAGVERERGGGGSASAHAFRAAAHRDLGIRWHRGQEPRRRVDGGVLVAEPCVVVRGWHAASRDAHNTRSPVPLSIRVGVATGEATEEDDDYFGAPVVEAARLCAHAEGGQILATDLVRLMVGRNAMQEMVSRWRVGVEGSARSGGDRRGRVGARRSGGCDRRGRCRLVSFVARPRACSVSSGRRRARRARP